MTVKITHLGAKDCVTGSCHLIEYTSGRGAVSVNILVDCGKAQGNDPELSFSRFPVPPEKIDYLFLTHAHIDHIGRVPDLIEAGFRGEIICTHATKVLLLPMLRDAMSFDDQHDEITERVESVGQFKTTACLSNKEIETLIDDLSWGFEFYETFELKQGITFKFKNAGHILGSCFVLFTFLHDKGSTYRVIFSGDLGCTDTPILPDPDPPDACDLLILESTYGDRFHPERKKRVEVLKILLKKALADKGIVYIPAFALGRTQELLYELDRINLKVPVFIDSPLGIEITNIYTSMAEFWDKESKLFKAGGNHPFDFKGLYGVERYQDHLKLLGVKGPAIVIAGSGMCTGGRIVEHLEQGLNDKKNDVIFVGYQAKGTPGRRLLEKKTPSKAAIHSLTSYSAHADQRMLVNWVRSMPEFPKEIRLVHGEAEARRSLAKALGL